MHKILFVLSRFPWPVDSGMKGLLSYWFEILYKRFNCDIHLFFVNQEECDNSLIPSFIKSYQYGRKVSGKTKIKNIVFKSMFGSMPLQNSLYYDKNNYNILRKYCDDLKPELVVFDMIRTANYVKAISDGITKCMYLGDLLSNRYMIQLQHKKYDNIFGKSGETGLFAKLSKNQFLSKLALKLESKKVYKTEIKCSRMFDKIAFISEKENNVYISRSNCNNSYVIPIGIDYNFFSSYKHDGLESKDNTLSFLGNMYYAPNYQSVVDICEKLLPHVKSDYKMIFVGDAPKELTEKYSSNKVQFTGKVDDVRPIIIESTLFCSPISFGTGVKTKIIEAFAMGKCVVTNSIGAENIDAVNGESFFVEDDYERLAHLIDELFKQKDTINTIGLNAQSVAKNKYTYDKVELAMGKVFFDK